ncbi:MAG: 1-acyl-sn-glycerol-3-phosphate acyltransferase [Deltaproteobacteria bacterium]|jgi:1-acyl-sn-glycerol-3-phosphate acyltransferase|nr:1-acyl-sn-glycerol-3-phosphate acyltransferase [Deltaproteobacteria bacterium]
MIRTIARALARAFAAAWYLPLFTVMTVSAGIVCLAGSVFSKRFARTVSGQVWASVVLGPAFIAMDVTGADKIPPGGGFIVYANHRSLLDIPAAAMAVEKPLSWIAKSALGRIPVFGWVLKRVHMLVEREGGAEAARKMITEAEARLAAGEILAIFPEGTRNRDASMPLLPFKKGAFILAKHTGAPLVPMAVVNSGNLWPSGSVLPRHGTIRVAIGDPVVPGPKEPLAALTRRARKALERLYIETATLCPPEAGPVPRVPEPLEAGAGPQALAEPDAGTWPETLAEPETGPGPQALADPDTGTGPQVLAEPEIGTGHHAVAEPAETGAGPQVLAESEIGTGPHAVAGPAETGAGPQVLAEPETGTGDSPETFTEPVPRNGPETGSES